MTIANNNRIYSSQEKEVLDEENALAIERKKLKAREEVIIGKKVYLRQETIQKQYSLFIATQNKNTQDSVYLNLVLLKSAIESYYIDIHRYKDFSGSKWANAHKQAAYTIKWLVRFRPIQIKVTTQHISEEIFDINLKFAIVCGFAFLNKKTIDLIMRNKQEQKENNFYDILLYDLRYRQLSGKKLILAFEALELATK
jgi:hypothetical protein